MRNLFTVFLFFISIASSAQITNISTIDFKLADSISINDLIGIFYKSNDFGGYNYKLDVNMTFVKKDFDCMSSMVADSGQWSLKNQTLILKSNKQTTIFDIIKFDDFYFFILPSEKDSFIKDVSLQKERLKNIKAAVINNRKLSTDYFVGSELREHYFAMDIFDK